MALELRAQLVVEPARHLVLDLVPDADQKHQVLLHDLVEGALVAFKTLLEPPMMYGTVPCALEASLPGFLVRYSTWCFL